MPIDVTPSIVKVAIDQMCPWAPSAQNPTWMDWKEAPEVEFIDDPKYRLLLVDDLGTLDSTINNREWKAATVLGGSLVEALLLWGIQKQSGDAIKQAVDRAVDANRLKRAPSADSNDWRLFEIIEVAAELELIGSAAKTETRLAKDFRNLIHPGRQQRSQTRCSAATAYSVRAAVQHAIEALETKLGSGRSGVAPCN